MRPPVCALALLAPALASAQTVCPESAPELFPLDRSLNVPTNGVVRILYREPFTLPDHQAENIIDVHEEVEEGLRVAGVASLGTEPAGTGAEAVWRSHIPLEPDTLHVVSFLDDLLAPATFEFTTGSDVDTDAPEFGGASDVEIVAAALDVDDPSYEVRVTFPPARDAVGSGNVEYVIYQTDGPDWTMPVERKRVRCGFGGSGIAAFLVPEEEIGRWACFQVRAVDMFGQTEENDEEACGIPEGPGVFRSICSVGAEGLGSMSSVFPIALAIVVRGNRRRAR